MKRTLKLSLVLTVGVLAMSSASILVRWAQAEHVPSLVIAAYRLTAATLVLSIPALRQQVWKDYAKLSSKQVGILLTCGVLLTLHFATWITSLAHTTVVSSLVLVSTTPLWIGLAGPLVLKERTSRLMWLGIALAIAGSAVIGLADLSNPYGGTGWGNLLALAGAWFAAGYLLIGRSVRDQLPFVAYVWIVYGTAAVLLMAWVALRGLPLAGYSLRAMGLMIALGLIPQLIGHTAANYAVRHLSATLVSIAVLGEPVGSTILAVFLLGEQPGLLQILGGILILAGIVFASQVEGIKEKLP